MRRAPAISVIALLLAALYGRAPVRAAQDDFQVIVNPQNPVDELDRGFLRDAFLKKASTWSGGEALRPVDLSRKFAVRERFARQILKKTLPQLKRYWSQQVFSGKGVPPPELESERAVVSYVLANKGAVGYLPSSSNTGGAKVVRVK
jgi:ABC-type phosphate transport system substrate-binding protein